MDQHGAVLGVTPRPPSTRGREHLWHLRARLVGALEHYPVVAPALRARAMRLILDQARRAARAGVAAATADPEAALSVEVAAMSLLQEGAGFSPDLDESADAPGLEREARALLGAVNEALGVPHPSPLLHAQVAWRRGPEAFWEAVEAALEGADDESLEMRDLLFGPRGRPLLVEHEAPGRQVLVRMLLHPTRAVRETGSRLLGRSVPGATDGAGRPRAVVLPEEATGARGAAPGDEVAMSDDPRPRP